MKKYQIIYADPPWDYGGRKLNASTNGKELNDHYPTMKIEDICKLPVKDLADKNCLLFMWVVYPLLDKAFEVIKSWGFKYSTVAFEWLKMTPNGKNVCFMGAWTCGGGIELCLLAKRGTIKRISKNVRKMIINIRQEHSKKPDIVRQRIVELVGDLPRVELFGRDEKQDNLFGWDKFEGWDVWGNEVKSDIDLEQLK
mgnify:CR=1 FL=1